MRLIAYREVLERKIASHRKNSLNELVGILLPTYEELIGELEILTGLKRAPCHGSAHARARARATDDERHDVRSAGVADWNTAAGGGQGAYAHRLGGSLSLRPLPPRPCKAAAPKGPAFCFF